MRLLTIEAFDDYISGTSGAWYTPASLNDQLGTPDALALHALPMDVAGTSPTLTCSVETSANGIDWLPFAVVPAINADALQNNIVCEGAHGYPCYFLHYVRVRISLGGTAPSCRLKLGITGIVAAGAGATQGQGGSPMRQPRNVRGRARGRMIG